MYERALIRGPAKLKEFYFCIYVNKAVGFILKLFVLFQGWVGFIDVIGVSRFR
jgi:hypothetical protein